MITARSGKEDNNLLVFLETESMRAEEKERIREEKRKEFDNKNALMTDVEKISDS